MAASLRSIATAPERKRSNRLLFNATLSARPRRVRSGSNPATRQPAATVGNRAGSGRVLDRLVLSVRLRSPYPLETDSPLLLVHEVVSRKGPYPRGADMKIGIIGAGQIGGTLTRRLTKLGHTVFVANSRGPETLADLSKETGAKAVPVKDAVRGVDLVVVTIPEKNIPKRPAGLLADVAPQVVVVDTGNYYRRQRDGRIDGIEQGLL